MQKHCAGKTSGKKGLSLTEAGKTVFRDALAETYPSHKVRSDFMVQLVFAHLLMPSQVLSLLQRRLSDIENNLAHIDSGLDCGNCMQSDGARFAAGYARAVLQAGKVYVEQNKDDFLHALENRDKQS